MDKFHSLLYRQIKKFFGDVDAIPPECLPLIHSVDQAYQEFDRDRQMLERAMEISSDELLQANEEIRTVLDMLIEMLFSLDEDGNILDYRIRPNSLAATNDPLVGSSIRDFFDGEITDEFDRAFAEVKQSRILTIFEFSLHFQEDHCYFEARLQPLKDGRFFLIVENITERKQALEREQVLQDKLAQAKRMESLGMLAGGVAHDLNNALGPLVGYPDLILQELGPDTPVKEDLEQIRSSANRAATMIQDLLTLSRRGARRHQPLHLSSVVEACMNKGSMMDLIRRHPNIHLDLELEQNLPLIEASNLHLIQCVSNLTHNAFEAIEESGSVLIRTSKIHLTQPRGMAEDFSPGDYVHLEVIDNGPGISDEDREHIFEPFFSKTKKGYSGSGLGLSVVYGIIQDVRGMLDIVTAPGKGAAFHLFFPITHQKTNPTRIDIPKDLQGTEHILVIDDEPAQRSMAKRILETHGYKVDTVKSGREAVTFTLQTKPDLLLLDMIMEEDFDGLRTYQEILHLHPNQACLVVSGYAENEKVRETQRLGAGDFIRKPYTPATLGISVRKELDRMACNGK